MFNSIFDDSDLQEANCAGGKSTTLRLLAGLETADSGRIMIGARDATARPPSQRSLSMVLVRARGEVRVPSGERARLRWAANAVHAFDEINGQCIARSQSSTRSAARPELPVVH